MLGCGDYALTLNATDEGRCEKCNEIKLSSESLLKVQLVRYLMKMQEINCGFEQDSRQGNFFHLDIPIYKKESNIFSEDN